MHHPLSNMEIINYFDYDLSYIELFQKITYKISES